MRKDNEMLSIKMFEDFYNENKKELENKINCTEVNEYIKETENHLLSKENSNKKIDMLLKGKKGLIIGLSNNMGIAWGITQKCAENGAELCIMYQNEAMKKRALPLAEEVGCNFTVQCDFSIDFSPILLNDKFNT